MSWKEKKVYSSALKRKVAPDHRKARIKGLKKTYVKIPSNVTNKQWLYGDFDRDGVPNYRDCFPLDKNRHSTRLNKSTLERAYDEPIFITPLGLESWEKAERFNNKTKKKYPEQYMRLSRLLKDDPSVLSRLERLNKGRRKTFLVYAKPDTYGKGEVAHSGWTSKGGKTIAIADTPINVETDSGYKKEEEVISQMGRKEFYDTYPVVEARKRQELVEIAAHEETHAEQTRRPFYSKKMAIENVILPYEKRSHEGQAYSVGDIKSGEFGSRKNEQEDRRKLSEEQRIQMGLDEISPDAYRMFD